MPFFEGASKFNINGGEFNDVAGNQHITKNSNNNNQTNSNNNNTYTATNSYNDSSRRTDRSRNTQHVNSGTVSYVLGTSTNVHYDNVNPQSVHTPPNPLLTHPTPAPPQQVSNPTIPYQQAMRDSHNPPQMLADAPRANSNNPCRQQQQLPNPFSREQSNPLPTATNPLMQGNYSPNSQQHAEQHLQNAPASAVDQAAYTSQPK